MKKIGEINGEFGGEIDVIEIDGKATVNGIPYNGPMIGEFIEIPVAGSESPVMGLVQRVRFDDRHPVLMTGECIYRVLMQMDPEDETGTTTTITDGEFKTI